MNINTLDLNLLLVLDAILRTRSTTLAGEKLGLTQSAVSNALKRLRLAFDDPLFVKTVDGMMPTHRAERMAEPIQAALLQIRRTVEDRGEFDPLESERTFRVSISDLGQMIMLPPMLEFMRTAAPHANLETVDASPHQAGLMLAKGEIDLAIGFLKELGEDYHSTRLMYETFVCMVRLDHPTIKEELTLEQYLQAGHAEYRPAGGSHSIVEEAVRKVFEDSGVKRRVALRLAHSSGLARMITHSDLLIAIPSRLAEMFVSYSPLKILPLPFPLPSYSITQQWHSRFHRDPGHSWFRNSVANLFKDK